MTPQDRQLLRGLARLLKALLAATLMDEFVPHLTPNYYNAVRRARDRALAALIAERNRTKTGAPPTGEVV